VRDYSGKASLTEDDLKAAAVLQAGGKDLNALEKIISGDAIVLKFNENFIKTSESYTLVIKVPKSGTTAEYLSYSLVISKV
jgi:hypothetical protein